MALFSHSNVQVVLTLHGEKYTLAPYVEAEMREVQQPAAPLLLGWNGKLMLSDLDNAVAKYREHLPEHMRDFPVRVAMPQRIEDIKMFIMDEAHIPVKPAPAMTSTSWATLTPEQILADIESVMRQYSEEFTRPGVMLAPNVRITSEAAPPESVCSPAWLRSIHRKG